MLYIVSQFEEALHQSGSIDGYTLVMSISVVSRSVVSLSAGLSAASNNTGQHKWVTLRALRPVEVLSLSHTGCVAVTCA